LNEGIEVTDIVLQAKAQHDDRYGDEYERGRKQGLFNNGIEKLT
jgi:hypothetical protein